jgi:hypothetical protein
VAGIDERFAAYVRGCAAQHLRVAVLLTGDWHAAEDLVQASLVKLYRAWPRLRPGSDWYQNFDAVPGLTRQLCAQHILRDLAGAAETYPGALARPGQATRIPRHVTPHMLKVRRRRPRCTFRA